MSAQVIALHTLFPSMAQVERTAVATNSFGDTVRQLARLEDRVAEMGEHGEFVALYLQLRVALLLREAEETIRAHGGRA